MPLLRGATKPNHRRDAIDRRTDGFGKTETEIEGRDRVACLGPLFEPRKSNLLVDFMELSRQSESGQLGASIGIAARCGGAQPWYGLLPIKAAKLQLRQRASGPVMSCLGGTAKPNRRFGMVGRQFASAD